MKVKQDTRKACRSRYNRLKSEGLCVKCGKKEAIESKTLCLYCKTVHNERASRYYHTTKKVV